MATDQRQILLNAIKCTQELRASVSKVFETLTDGLKKPDEDENSQKTFLANVQQGLLAVNNDMRYRVLEHRPLLPLSYFYRP